MAEIAELLGQGLLGWQRLVADVALEVDPGTNRLAYRQIVLTLPRQNGKTWLELAVMIHRCLAFGGKESVLYCAQDLNSARKKWMEDMVPALEGSRLRKLFKVRRSNGSEAIEFHSGARLGISANTLTSGHGSTLDLVVLDEAFAQTDDRAETSFRPPMITRPQPQLWIVSTAGDDMSTYLRSKVELGRVQAGEGLTHGAAYFEWSAPHDADPSDEATWWAAMPALGKTITVDAVRADQLAMPPGAFARSCLNLWSTGAGEPVIDPEKWAASADKESDVDSSIAIAIDVSPNRESAAIALAGTRLDGRAHVEVIDHRPGTRWVVDRVTDLVARWSPVAIALDPVGPAGSLLPRLLDAGIDVMQIGAREHAQACGALYDLVMAGDLRHMDQPQLNSAVAGARKRPLGDAFAFSRKGSGVDISPLVAATLAVHARGTAKESESVYETRGFLVLG